MEMVKNMVYAGVGLASMTSEKVKETIEELVEKGRISDTEGKRIVQDFFSSTEKRREDFESKFKMATEKVTEKFDFLTKEKEIQALNDKIQSLEIFQIFFIFMYDIFRTYVWKNTRIELSLAYF